MNELSYSSYVFRAIDSYEHRLFQSWVDKFYLVAVFISLQLVFPFYAYVNRVNRERDKNTLVFPLVNHFYAMMKVTHVIYYIIYSPFLCYLMYKIFGPSVVLGTIVIFSSGAIVLLLFVVFLLTQVFQLFLTIMAIQKFLLYFFPSSQEYIILSAKNMKLFIRYVYVSFILIEVISFISLFAYAFIKFGENEERSEVVDSLTLILLVSIDIIFLASAVLYIPILISVQKHSRLRSVQESKPQIYIFWQTMTVLVVKMINTSASSYHFSDRLIQMILDIRGRDCFAVPFIIQISYLTCNRHNVIALFSLFKGKKLIKELIVPEVTTRVSPDPRRHMV